MRGEVLVEPSAEMVERATMTLASASHAEPPAAVAEIEGPVGARVLGLQPLVAGGGR
jgi:hypothetical protein